MEVQGGVMGAVNVCAGCLSSGRRAGRLGALEWEYLIELLHTAGCVHVSPAELSVCWQCAADVRRGLRLRQQLAAAQDTLARYQRGEISHLSSLSPLSSQTMGITYYISHKDDQKIDVGTQPLFIKMEDGEDTDGWVDESGVGGEDHDLKAVLTADVSERVTPLDDTRTTRDRDGAGETGFDSSDEEPLTVKQIKKCTEKISSEKKEVKKKGRGRRERAAGVVGGARVVNKLRQLGVPPGALEMVLLSWEEVEACRDRALQAARRHEHVCAWCALGFNHRAKLAAHMDKHQPSAGPLECSSCHVRCKDSHALNAHRRRHRVRWRCSECGALWSRASVAADHYAREHGAALPTHTCRVCNHVASSLGKLRSHMKEHAERQRCEICGKSFRDRASLRTHLFIHRGEKEHECGVCGKKFLFKTAMQLHAATHDKHQHLYCYQCDVTFKNRMSLYQHMKYNLKHIDPAKLKHSCAQCPMRFARAARLAEHRAARHAGLAPLSCTQPACTYSCASRGVLRAHVRVVHRGVRARRDHVCHTCGKMYTTKKSLEGHLRAHAGERPFVCGQCGAAFTYHAALYNHQRLLHRVPATGRSRAGRATANAQPTVGTQPAIADTQPPAVSNQPPAEGSNPPMAPSTASWSLGPLQPHSDVDVT